MIGLLVLCLVLAGVAASPGARSATRPTSADGAITSAAARDEGLQAATTLTEKVLSYDWQTLDKDVKAAEAVLAPSFRSEYAKTMAGVRDQTIKNQVKLTAEVAATSVVWPPRARWSPWSSSTRSPRPRAPRTSGSTRTGCWSR